MFRHEQWNKVYAVLNDEDTTTNCSEGFNNAIQLSIPLNANVFLVIKQFKADYFDEQSQNKQTWIYILLQSYFSHNRLCYSWLPIRQSTGNNISGHYFCHFFSFLPHFPPIFFCSPPSPNFFVEGML